MRYSIFYMTQDKSVAEQLSCDENVTTVMKMETF